MLFNDSSGAITYRSHRSRAVRSLAGGLVLGLLFSLGVVSAASAATPVCGATQLSARIVLWQGAAGSRIADVFLVNTSFTTCRVRDYPRAQLVSANGHILINGSAASTSGALHTILPLGFLKSEVIAGNYCGPAYAKPVSLAFVLPGSLGRVIAIPRSAADVSGVPPCLGSPGSAGHISMHAWHT